MLKRPVFPTVFILIFSCSLAACDRTPERSTTAEQTTSSTPQPKETIPQPVAPEKSLLPANTVPAPKPERTREVAGLTLRDYPGGMIALAGNDRFGKDFDTTYENRDFLRKALPVLERSFSPEAIAAIGKLLDAEPNPPTH